jgi:outer membrane usher protein
MNRARACTFAAAVLMQTLATGSLAQNTRPDAPAGLASQDRIIPLEATVNGAKAGAWPFVERAGALYVSPEAIEEWRLQLPAGAQPIRVRGADFLPLAALPGFSARLNSTALTVDLSFAPEAFAGTRLALETELQRPKPSPVLPSVFANYDLSYQQSSQRGSPTTRDLGALLELGASNDWGVFTTSEVGRNLTGGVPGEPRKWLRLESTYTRNFPERDLTLRLGDSATRAGLWGRNVYFGGFQLGTNFALTPGFLTQPLPLVSGISAAPSTVELYVNDVLRKVSQVPTGPFVIDNSLGLTGSGETRVVVRDILGREVVIVQPFFTSVQLLAPGLNDWSVESGAVRRNLGLADADYGQRFASGTWRRGLSDRLTLEGRGEWTRGHANLGTGAIAALPADLLARAAYARSRDPSIGDGNFRLLGVERQWARAALSVQLQAASRHYRELGLEPSQPPTRRQLAANLTQQFGSTTLAFGYARIARYDAPAVATYSMNWGWRLWGNASINANVSRVVGPAGGTSFGVTLQLPLDNQRFASASVAHHGGGHDAYASVAQFATDASDIGWRVLGGQLNSDARAEAGLDYAGRYGRIYSDLSASPSQNSLRVGASGGLALAAGRAFFTRRLDESFAVVELKGYPGVGVGLGSTPTAVTDASGIAFVPYLSPYQSNQVRLQASDLPISAELDSIEQMVVPSWRSAVKVEFPVRSGRAALVKIHQDNGEPVPAGAVVQIRGDKEEMYVGRRGEAFVTGLQPNNELLVRWRGGRCSFALALPPAANDEVLRLGPVTCRRSP